MIFMIPEPRAYAQALRSRVLRTPFREKEGNDRRIYEPEDKRSEEHGAESPERDFPDWKIRHHRFCGHHRSTNSQEQKQEEERRRYRVDKGNREASLQTILEAHLALSFSRLDPEIKRNDRREVEENRSKQVQG